MADQDYIFISYKGEDPEALEIIRRLKHDGYRIWYDDGILPSDEWPTEIAERIEGSSYFITLITDAFLRSIWFSKELTFAQQYKKPILPVYLTDAPLPKGPAFILVDLRGIYRSACRSDDALYQEIYKAKGLDAFRYQPEKEASPAPVSKPAPQTGSTASKAETINYPSGGSYTGETKNGQPHGFGTMSYSYSDYKKRDYYSGYWQNGQRHGQGKLVYRDGKVEEGVWSANTLLSPRKADAKPASAKPKAPEAKPASAKPKAPEAKPAPAKPKAPEAKPAPVKPKAPEQKGEIITFPNGNVYEGEVLDGKPHGQGTMTYAKDNKSKMVQYVGAWQNGKRHGQGRLTWNDGDAFEGLWVDGSREGHGVYRWHSGNVYDGEWKQGKRCGQGKMTWTNGNVYEGAWADGKRSGHGVLRCADGSVQEGEWVGDLLREKKEILYEDGSRYFGMVLDDEPHGSGTMNYAVDDEWKRKSYTGEWKNGLRHGKGRLEWAFGDVYDGDWVDGQMSGKGNYQYADGRRYTGDWKDGKQHGRGIFRDAKGMVFDGPFANGMQEGVFTVYPSLNPGAARKVTFHEDEEVAAPSLRPARKIMRNDPCPCGKKKPDGRPYKYKECCGKELS